MHNAHGQAHFQLKEQYEHAHLAHPDDYVGNEVTSINEIVEDNEEQTFEPSNDNPSLPILKQLLGNQEFAHSLADDECIMNNYLWPLVV